jgi:hypothetical protein
MNVSSSGTALVIDGTKVELGHPILQAMTRENLVVVRVDDSGISGTSENYGRNIFAVDRDGKEIWRIAVPGWIDKTISGETIVSPWVRLRGDPASGDLKADDGGGFSYELDPATGKLSNAIFRK